jgi:hypothetical protein
VALSQSPSPLGSHLWNNQLHRCSLGAPLARQADTCGVIVQSQLPKPYQLWLTHALYTYLMLDAFDNDFEGAVVVSNDSDLAEPIRLVRTRFHHKIAVLYPCSRSGRGPSIELRKATGLRAGNPPLVIENPLLAASQFPPILTDATGNFHKPATW